MSDFSTHSKTKKHKINADGNQGRLENQPSMISSTAADRESEAENHNEENIDDPDEPEDGNEEGQVGLGRGRFGTRGSSRVVGGPRNSAISVLKAGQSAAASMPVNDRANYAEI